MSDAKTDKKAARQAVSLAPSPTTACSGNMPAAITNSAAKAHITRFRRGKAQVSSGL